MMRRIIRHMAAALDVQPLLKNLAAIGRTRKQLLSLVIDAGLSAISIWAAFSLRLGELFADIQRVWYLFIVIPALTVLVFAALGVYRWVVRASTPRQFEQLIKGVAISSLVLPTIFFLDPSTSAPRSVFIIYGLLLLFGAVGYRLVWARIQNSGIELSGKPVVIYGAGDAGRQIVNLMKLSKEYCPEFFLDDNVALDQTIVNGLRIHNPSNPTIDQLLKKHAVDEIIIAMPSVQGEIYAKRLSEIEKFGVLVKTIPSLHEIVSGYSAPDEFREIRLEDLLGRKPVEPIQELLTKNINDKCVLVTGAGGSIGSELCRQIVSLRPECLILLDHSEHALYEIDKELRPLAQAKQQKLITSLVSITDQSQLDSLIAEHKPHTVYHAAAYKHVPLLESNPEAAINTNVFGTLNLLQASKQHYVETFVLISTDKAIKPVNMLGATKRLAELVVKSYAESSTTPFRASIVRFGNVLGSSGSVIPLFSQQIEQGGPVTVTHPEMTRYFMLIPEAVSLVIQAGSLGKGGDVFVLDMGKPVNITDLARTMIRLHGLRNSSSETLSTRKPTDIEIVYTGIRPGEKLNEEVLITDNYSDTVHPKIKQGQETQSVSELAYTEMLATLVGAVLADDRKGLMRLVQRLASRPFQIATPKPVSVVGA